MIIERPPFYVTPLKQGLNWRPSPEWLYEEKMDGCWALKGSGKSIIAGEQMRDGRFIAFDVPILDGTDIRHWLLKDRLVALDSFGFLRPARGQGAEFLEAVLANGGEGVVAKNLYLPWGEAWHKCKRIQTFDLRVIEKIPGMFSIRLADPVTGEDRGKCSCFSQYYSLRVGSIVEIAAFAMTAKGKLREPRFVRCRPDK